MIMLNAALANTLSNFAAAFVVENFDTWFGPHGSDPCRYFVNALMCFMIEKGYVVVCSSIESIS
jgi:hypothetical protein